LDGGHLISGFSIDFRPCQTLALPFQRVVSCTKKETMQDTATQNQFRHQISEYD